jgi:hypothetical protein
VLLTAVQTAVGQSSLLLSMWPLICQLPAELLASQVLGMLDLIALLRMDKIPATKSGTWREAMKIMPPLRLPQHIKSYLPALQWLLNNDVHILQACVELQSGTTKSLDDYAQIIETAEVTLKPPLVEVSHSRWPAKILQKATCIYVDDCAAISPVPRDVLTANTGKVVRLTCSDITDSSLPSVLWANNPDLCSITIRGLTSPVRPSWLIHFQTSGDRLDTLALHGAILTTGDVNTIAACCPNLKQLTMSMRTTPNMSFGDDIATAFAEHCPGLTSFTHDGFAFGVAGVQALRGHCPKLVWQLDRLEYCCYAAAPTLFRLLAEHNAIAKAICMDRPLVGDLALYDSWLSRIESTTWATPFMEWRHAVTVAARMTGLVSLTLRCTSGGSAMCAFIEQVAVHCRDVQRLTIWRAPSAAVCSMVRSGVQLSGLVIYCAHDCDEEGKRRILAEVAVRGSQWERLMLDGLDVTDTDMFPVIAASPNLSSLYITNSIRYETGTNLSDATVLALAKHCPQLETLTVRSKCKTSPVTEATLLTLVERCRKLQLVMLPWRVLSSAAKAQLEEDHRSGRRLHRITFTP